MSKRPENDPPEEEEDQEPTRLQTKPRFGDSKENPTRRRSVTSTQTKPLGPVRAHDAFEVDIDVDEREFRVSDLFNDTDTEDTCEVPPLEINPSPIEDVIDLSLPESSDQEALPFYVPVGRRTPSPLPPARNKSPSPASRAPLGPDFEALFDAPMGDDEPVEPAAVHLAPERERSPAGGLPLFMPGAPRATTPGSDSKPKPRFKKGLTAGMTPLDMTDFAADGPRRRKKSSQSRFLPRSAPAPMAGSKKVVRRRFVFTVTVRDVILLLLVLVLAAGVYIGWKVFDEYRHDKEIQQLGLKQQLIEKSKNDAIKKKEPVKERDIP
ncbi:MAG TPA: hypothetical protein VM425_15665 [Myxococcota bacterium]|nr:hypothetical protein [Myxococcota bacterium]